MVTTDPIADMLTRIRNAITAKHDKVLVPASNMKKAIAQIRDRRYAEYLMNDGRNQILYYGIAFHRKRCRVIVERHEKTI